MNNFITNIPNFILGKLLDAREFSSGILSENFWWIKPVSLILSVLFIMGIIFIGAKVHYISVKIDDFIDKWNLGGLFEKRTIRAWKVIRRKMASNKPEDWKGAISQADTILNELLKMMGYTGRRIEDKLEILTTAQLSNLEDIKNAHRAVVKIAADPEFSLTKEEAVEVFKVYKKTFIDLNLISE